MYKLELDYRLYDSSRRLSNYNHRLCTGHDRDHPRRDVRNQQSCVSTLNNKFKNVLEKRNGVRPDSVHYTTGVRSLTRMVKITEQKSTSP